MSQEFESRVNELVVARNLPYNEAAEIVTRELAEEGVEETQKKKDTNSESSDGRFSSVEQPSLPLTAWQVNQIAENPEFEEDIINTSRTAADQSEVDSLNAEYQARVDKYNSEFNTEATKLIDVLSETQDEGYEDIYSRFQEETGVSLNEDQIKEITALATERKDNKIALDSAYKKAQEESNSTGRFDSLQGFYQELGYGEEEIEDIEVEWNGARTRNEAISSAFEFSPNVESFTEDISALNLDPEREQAFIASYTKAFNEAGEAMYESSINSPGKLSRKARALEKQAREIERDLGKDNLALYKQGEILGREATKQGQEYERLMFEASQLRGTSEQARSENRKVKDFAKAHPVAVRSAFSLIASAERQFLEGASEEVLSGFYNGSLTFEEAIATQFNRD
ncbi:MAG TPA: hypothetical protein DCY51_01245, partial [Bacteroidetes bacterium]|nr:hypothetical protein [Bacteroidota bacterium]